MNTQEIRERTRFLVDSVTIIKLCDEVDRLRKDEQAKDQKSFIDALSDRIMELEEELTKKDKQISSSEAGIEYLMGSNKALHKKRLCMNAEKKELERDLIKAVEQVLSLEADVEYLKDVLLKEGRSADTERKQYNEVLSQLADRAQEWEEIWEQKDTDQEEVIMENWPFWNSFKR